MVIKGFSFFVFRWPSQGSLRLSVFPFYVWYPRLLLYITGIFWPMTHRDFEPVLVASSDFIISRISKFMNFLIKDYDLIYKFFWFWTFILFIVISIGFLLTNFAWFKYVKRHLTQILILRWHFWEYHSRAPLRWTLWSPLAPTSNPFTKLARTTKLRFVSFSY